MTSLSWSVNFWGWMLILSLIAAFTIAGVTLMFAYKYVFGESYMKGNNTIANITAVNDLNNESDYDSPVRLTHPHPEYDWTQEDLDCKLFGKCVNITQQQENITKQLAAVIECPRSFTAETMKEYYDCMGGRN